MLVTFNRYSWHSRYYNWVKGVYPTYQFKSLCPYFWTIVSYILLSPVIVLWKIFKSVAVKPITKAIDDRIKRKFDKILSEPYVKKEPSKFFKWFDKHSDTIEKWGQRIYFGMIGLVVLIILVAAIIQLFKEKGPWMSFIYIFAWIGAITSSVFIVWGIISFFETDAWRAVKGMSYSVKNKVCPMIKWD